MNQGDFLICVAAGFFCAGHIPYHCDGGSKREGRKDDSLVLSWKEYFFFFFGNQGGNDGKV